VDLDGDEDVIAFVRDAGGHTALEALSGGTGARLWRSGLQLAERIQPKYLFAGVIGSGLLVFDGAGGLALLEAGTGAMAWSQRVHAVDVDLCRTNAAIGVRAKGGALRGFMFESGEPVPVSDSRCTPWHSSRADGPNFSFVDPPRLRSLVPASLRFLAKRALVPNVGVARVLLGSERASPAVAAIAVIAEGRLLWPEAAELGDEGASMHLAPPLAAVRNDQVVVVYRAKDELHIASLKLASGDRLWDLPMGREPLSDGSDYQLLVSEDARVYLRTPRNELQVLALADGERLWRVSAL
jgi:outer membrane protein assembly factor BamB